jgi:hypothetical protein
MRARAAFFFFFFFFYYFFFFFFYFFFFFFVFECGSGQSETTPRLGASSPSPQHSNISSQARRRLPYLIIVRRGRLRGFFSFPGV